MNREKLDELCESGILWLVLGILVFGPLALGANRTWAFLVVESLTLLVMFCWMLRLWIAKSPKFLMPPITWVAMGFMAWTFYQYKQADIEYAARWEMVRVLVYGCLFLAIINNLHSQDAKQTIGLTLIFLAMTISCYAVYQVVSKNGKVYNIPNVYEGRGSGTFIYPNHLAGFLEMILPLGIAYVFIGRLSHVTKILLCYACLCIAAGIAATMSRGGYLVTALALVALCAFFLTQRDYRIQGLVLLSLLVVTMAIAIPRMGDLRGHMNRKIVDTGKTDDMRLALWGPATKMWKDHFWTGVGPGLFDYNFGPYRPVQVQMRPLYVHNDYLNTLVDYGVVGAAFVGVAVALLYWGIFRNWRVVRGSKNDFARKKSSKFALMVGGSVGIFAILVHSCVDFNMHLPANAILAITLMALLSSQWRFATESYWFRAAIPLRTIATIVILALICYLGTLGIKAGREFVWLNRAEELNTPSYHYSDYRIYALEQAIKVEPKNFTALYELGECFRQRSWDGADAEYKQFGRKALDCFMQSAKLNAHDSMNWLRGGMCVDWIGYHADGTRDDSSSYYMKANELDPNNYFVTLHTGWHYAQVGDLAAARSWFERSIRFEWKDADNPIAYNYLKILDKQMKDSANAQNN